MAISNSYVSLPEGISDYIHTDINSICILYSIAGWSLGFPNEAPCSAQLWLSAQNPGQPLVQTRAGAQGFSGYHTYHGQWMGKNDD